MELNKAVNDYLLNSYATKKNNTYKWEEKTFRSFSFFTLKHNIHTTDDLNNNVMFDYIGYEKKRGLQNVTLNKKISLIKRMLNYHDIDSSILKIKKLREKKKTVDRLSDNELKLLFQYLKSLDLTIHNNYVYSTLYRFILDSGVRIHEAINIKKNNVNFDHQVIHLEETKYSKERFVDFSTFTKKDLIKLSHMHNGEYLFWNINKNRKISYDSDIQYFYRKINKESNIKGLTAHRLRHTFASISAQNGMNILSLKEILGHENLRTTQIYLHADRKKTKQDYNKYSPFSQKT
ncbi:MAG: site-specific integrase [Acholeplasma sp.]|nr:site-specific integrase [Acholeplasma sp.]